MPKKIIIAVDNDIIRDSYLKVFEEGGFEVFGARTGKEVIDLIEADLPDIILLDTLLPEMNNFELLKMLKTQEKTKLVPVVVVTQFEKQEEKTMAFDFEVKDFISTAEVSPFEAVRRVKIILGEQKTYKIPIDITLEEVKKMAADVGYHNGLICPNCSSGLILRMIRDLKAGDNHFIVSFVCPKCD